MQYLYIYIQHYKVQYKGDHVLYLLNIFLLCIYCYSLSNVKNDLIKIFMHFVMNLVSTMLLYYVYIMDFGTVFIYLFSNNLLVIS